ncbi:MAG TPA: hypothetical protein VLA71_07780 [Algoriphagus sp.]|nr:hypothetical protein [Algoriphagus sp.]
MKKDYIVVADTALSQGHIKGIPTEGNTVIHFARSKKENYTEYSVQDLTEFRVSERLFFSKNIQIDGKTELVFLEKLPQEVPGAVLWKLNGEVNLFYLETSEGLQVLGDGFRRDLAEAFANPDLVPLIDITSLSELPLIYLSKTAKTIQKPRTFTKLFTLTPFVGYSSQTVGLTIPDSNQEVKIGGSSPAFGINGEAFLTFKRNLSLNVGVVWTQFDSQEFFKYEYGGKPYELDVFLDFSLIQIPITAKYYYDFRPNKMRLFAEVGYSYALPSYDELGVFQAEFGKNSVVTSSKSFEMEEKFLGYVWGFGVEKYLSRHRGVVLGLRQFKVTSVSEEFVQGLTFHLGYKF